MRDWTVCAALTATVLTAAAGSAIAETKIGLVLSRTGVFAALGKEIDDGFVFALEEAGKAGDFAILREDDESKPPVGVAKIRKLVLDNNVDDAGRHRIVGRARRRARLRPRVQGAARRRQRRQ